MFSWMPGKASEEPRTRFNAATDFKAIKGAIQLVRDKNNKLKELGEGKPASLEYIKSFALTQLLTRIDEKVNAFNAQQSLPTTEEERRAYVQLCSSLLEALVAFQGEHLEALNLARNNYRDYAKSAAKWSITGGAIAAGITVPLTFFGSGLLTWCLSLEAGSAVYNTVGLSEVRTHTAKLVDDLSKTITDTKNGLLYTLGERHRVTSTESSDTRRRRANDEVSALDLLSPAIEEFAARLRIKFETEGKPSETIDKLKLTDAENKELNELALTDCITLEIFDIPVRVDGAVFELDSLMSISPGSDGSRKDPTQRFTFYPRDLQPAWDVVEHVEAYVKAVREQRRLAAAPSAEGAGIRSPHA